MTTFEKIMLAVCFGAMLGNFIGQLVLMIQWWWADRKEKKRKDKDEQ